MSVHYRNVDPIDHGESNGDGQEAESPWQRISLGEPRGSDLNRDEQEAEFPLEPLELVEPPCPDSGGGTGTEILARRSLDSITEATDNQLLKRIVRVIEYSGSNTTTILGLLEKLSDSTRSAIDTSSPRSPHTSTDPRPWTRRLHI